MKILANFKPLENMVLLDLKKFLQFLSICFNAGKLMRIPNVQSMSSLIFSLTYIIHHQSKPNSSSDIPILLLKFLQKHQVSISLTAY